MSALLRQLPPRCHVRCKGKQHTRFCEQMSDWLDWLFGSVKCCRLISEVALLYVNFFRKIKAGALPTSASAGETGFFPKLLLSDVRWNEIFSLSLFFGLIISTALSAAGPPQASPHVQSIILEVFTRDKHPLVPSKCFLITAHLIKTR